MLVASIRHLQYRYPNQHHDVFTDVNISIKHNSKIGIVGRNGSGKSTLLALLRGALKPQEGQLEWMLPVNIGYLPQEIAFANVRTVEDYLWQSQPALASLKQQLNQLGDSISVEQANAFDDFYQLGGYQYEAKIALQLANFGFQHTDLQRTIATLSGGEQTKIALCALILAEPNLLLLDEPGNHLDEKTVVWLEEYLAQLTIPYLLISHDRHLLNRCATDIITLENGMSTHYSGNYDFYKQQTELQYAQQLMAHEKQTKKLRQLQAAATQREQWTHIRQKHTRSIRNNGGVCKRDDGSLPASRLRLTRQVGAVRKRIELTIEREQANKPFLTKQRKLMTTIGQDISNRFVLQVEKLTKRYANNTLFSDLSFTVAKSTRLAIVGDNGTGKSTLLQILMGQVAADAGQWYWPPQATIAYYDQMTLNLDHALTALENCQRYCQDETLIRTTLGQLFFADDSVTQPITTISPGERSKVALAQMLLQQANVLILDEPGNHLEIAAREALEQALIDYSGTIIFVSHDRYFRERLATENLLLT